MPRRQRGLTLVVGLIMLLVLTLAAVAAFHIGANQTVVIGNAQHRNEGVDAAQQAIDIVLNTSNFTVNPAAAIPNSNCATGGANSLCVDSNGDQVNDFTVRLSPQPNCVVAAPIPVNQLDFSNQQDLACAPQSQQSFGVANANQSGSSLCANSNWEIAAQAVDPSTSTKVTVVQGVAVRIATTDAKTYCN